MIKPFRRAAKNHRTDNQELYLKAKHGQFPVSDHCDGYYFFNPSGTTPKGFKDIVKWKLNNQRKYWPKWIENSARLNLLLLLPMMKFFNFY